MKESKLIDNQYDEIPIIYCQHCLSLKIKSFMSDVSKYSEKEGTIDDYDYCDGCGSTDLITCNIKEYQELYKNKYGFYPLENY